MARVLQEWAAIKASTNLRNMYKNLRRGSKWTLSKLIQSWGTQARIQQGGRWQRQRCSSQEVRSRSASPVQFRKRNRKTSIMKVRVSKQKSSMVECTLTLQLWNKTKRTGNLVEKHCSILWPKRLLISNEAHSLFTRATCQKTCAHSCNKRRHGGIQSRSFDKTTLVKTVS